MSNIRNFCIIAHIDHGKSTLADRLLELTGTIPKEKMREQYLDQMDLERERGITIKMQPVRMLWHPDRGLTQNNTQNDAENFLYGDLTYKIRGVIFQVRKKIGLGHKEQVYRNALEIEFKKAGLKFESKKNISILYEGKNIGIYQPDFIIENKILIELKALPEIGKPQTEQLWSYLKGCNYKLALLVNFGSKDLGIKRIVYDTARQSTETHFQHHSALSASSLRESAGAVDQIKNNECILNLIDTPGHVDFTYEVSRSLAAVEGAILLVDAVQGIQAQTLANFYLAKKQNLAIIPVINKIDLPAARTEEVAQEIIKILECKEDEIIKISAKQGTNVDQILEAIIERIPSPKINPDKLFRALIFDSHYDNFQGVVAYIRIIDGEIKRGDKVKLMAVGKGVEVKEVGIFNPELKPREKLTSGEIGYLTSGLKDIDACRVGDTVAAPKVFQALPGYQPLKPMVYATFYIKEGENFEEFKKALAKLSLNDAALTFETETSTVLGRGIKCGFLGLLHLEITQERLRREFNIHPFLSAPSVKYKITTKNKQEKTITSSQEFPDPSQIQEMLEPYANLEIITPNQYLGAVMELTKDSRAEFLNQEYFSENRIILKYEIPLSELIIDFYDRLKSVTSGYASMNYELIDFKPVDLVKLDILVAGDAVDTFSRLVVREKAEREGRRIVECLKEAIPRHNFAIPLQAAVGGKIIAREDIKAVRKDVTAKLYGGDVTRKMKLLKKQKEGKKRLAAHSKVNIPPQAYLAVLKK